MNAEGRRAAGSGGGHSSAGVGTGPGEPARGLSARTLAARVVHRVLDQGAFVSETLDAELSKVALDDARDRAFATELSYGAVRLSRPLGERLDALSPRGAARSDPLARAHLLVAAHQLLALDRVPAFAAINEAVEALRELRGARVAGFANAILRRLSREPRLVLPDALSAAAPPWLWAALSDSVGRESALALLGATEAAARRGLCVRLTSRAAEVPAWLAGAEPGRWAPRTYWLPPAGDLRQRPGYAEGHFVVQEEGAQWTALALGVRAGERVLDACAGHGQKASLLAERLGERGRLSVNDIGPRKLELLRREFERLGLERPECFSLDLTISAGDLPAGFDRILVDAPCTGTGTLRRRPEIALRLGENDASRLAEQSFRIIRNLAPLLRPGGRLCFVVCSVLRAECEAVSERILAELGALLEPAPFDAPEALAIVGEGGAWQYRLLPQVHGTDAYYIASFSRRST
jgi:16S rRNA (cytosine967-C5)-methyltransferase